MFARARVLVSCLAFVSITAASAQQPDCSAFVRDAFNTSLKSEGASSSKTFHAWECTTEFSSHDDAINSGLDVGVVYQGVPIKIGGTFDKATQDAWKKTHCATKDATSDAASNRLEFIRTFAPEAAALAAKCLDAAYGPRAVYCSLSDGATPVFNAEWRRTAGDNANPVVRRFTVQNGSCSPKLQPKETLVEGGRPAIC